LQDALKTNASQIVIANLHNGITRSFSSRAMAVRLVTTNKGKNTAGIDKTIWKSDSSKSKVIEKLSKIK
jgi:retron-type reverse transcriptase